MKVIYDPQADTLRRWACRWWIAATVPGSVRLYFLEIPGKMGWKARYLKEVDAAERTLRFWQAIYDSHNRIVEIHEKFPVDRGHQPMEDSQQ